MSHRQSSGRPQEPHSLLHQARRLRVLRPHREASELKYLRFHLNDVVERWGFDRFDLTFYVLRHFYASEALKRGLSTVLVSRAMGTSTENIENVYGHIVMSEESMIRQLYSLD